MTETDRILDCEQFLEGNEAVIFDLDDTLYSEKDYIKCGFKAAAGLHPEIANCEDRLWEAFEAGEKPLNKLFGEKIGAELEAYRNCVPELTLYHGVKEMLLRLRTSGKKLGMITDGRPEGQRAKIKALGIEDMFDKIIITDELGGAEFRKPNPKAFRLMLEALGCEAGKSVYIGDNAGKDFIAPEEIGMKCIWFRNPDGIYRGNK